MRSLRWLLVLLLNLVMGVSAVAGDETRTVTGVVINSDGSEVAGASVSAMPIGDASSAGELRWITADDHGKFRVRLPPGRYVIRAKLEDAGYPDPTFLFCADPIAGFPETAVEQEDINAIRVLLREKGGVLEGELRDKATQAPIRGGEITLRDPRNPAALVRLTTDEKGRFGFTVPHKAIWLSAAARGYRAEDPEKPHEVTLGGGERRHVVVELRHE